MHWLHAAAAAYEPFAGHVYLVVADAVAAVAAVAAVVALIACSLAELVQAFDRAVDHRHCFE